MPERHHHHHHHYHHEQRDRDGYAYHAGEPGPGPNPHRLRRSANDKWFAGVCGGLAEFFGWSSAPIRIAFGIGVLSPVGPAALIAYLVLWMVMKPPVGGEQKLYRSMEEERFWRTVSTKPKATFSQLRHKFRALDARVADMEEAIVSEEWGLRKAFRDLERGAWND